MRTSASLVPISLPLACFLSAFVVMGSVRGRCPVGTARTEVEARIDELLARMTLEEKVGQLQQLDSVADEWRVRDEHREPDPRGLVGSFLNVRGAKNINEAQRLAVEQSRLKIPLLFGFDVIHGYRTIFPIPLGEAEQLGPGGRRASARIAAAEAAATGLKWTFAPMVDIARDPRWGRISEGSARIPTWDRSWPGPASAGFKATTPPPPIGSWPAPSTGSPTARRRGAGIITPWTSPSRPCAPSIFRRSGRRSRRARGP